MTENDAAVANVTTDYGYDPLNRLTSATNTTTNTALEYYYDAAGNRCNSNSSSPPVPITSCSSPTYTYNSPDQLTAGPTGSYTYDGSGEETSSPQLSNLTYNTAAQTTSITPSGGSANGLAYADVGQADLVTDGSTTLANGPLGLDSATTGGTTTYFIRDPEGNVIGEKTGTSSSLYFLKDALGSVTAVINGAGSTVSDRYSYDPYGNMSVISGTDYEPIRYAGGYYDGSSGLTKFGTRYYDSTTGRWTQMDPVGGSVANPSTLNGYIYAGDDSVNGTDPSGLCTVGVCLTTIWGAIVNGATIGGTGGLIGGCAVGAWVLGIGCIPAAGTGATIFGLGGIAVGAVVGVGEDIASFF
jgi:RHS repeat-associated protein